MCNSFLTHVDQSMVSNTMYTFKNRRRRKRHETGGNRIDAELGSVWGGRFAIESPTLCYTQTTHKKEN